MHLLGPEELELLSLWQQWRPSMGGVGPLPFSGGTAEQPAALMEAFALMSAAAAQLARKKAGGEA